MRADALLVAGLLVLPVAVAEEPPPEPELLELLGEAGGEGDGFEDYLLSPEFAREQRRIEKQQQAAKDASDER